MYFICKKDSITGKKFQQIFSDGDKCFDEQIKTAKEFEVKEWRGAVGMVYGGFSSVIFQDHVKVDTKYWKEVLKGEYMPKQNSKIGKAINEKFMSMPTIHKYELNSCIGWKDKFNSIGTHRNDEYFGIDILESWDIKMPEDCEEVVSTRWKEVFKQ